MIVVRPQARREIDEIAAYIAIDQPNAARRFLGAVQDALQILESAPLIGAPWHSRRKSLANVRRFSLRRFPNYLIFYRPRTDGIEVLHLFHGARDIVHLLDE